MPDLVQIRVSDNAAEVIRQLEQFPPAMAQALAAALDVENELTIGQIQARKLSRRGPTTLGVRTNRLRSSMSRAEATIAGTSILSSIGSNVVYAGVHEYGIDADVNVRAHRRRIIAHDRYEKRGRGFVQTQSGIKGLIAAHSRHMKLPARRYMGSTIEARTPNYTAALSAAIVTAWGGDAATP